MSDDTLRQPYAALEAQLAALTEKQRSCEAAFNGYIQETAHALSPDDPCVATTTEQIMSLQQERDEYKATAAWFLALVPRANIGTEKTPSLRAYIEQIEQQLARARAALEAIVTAVITLQGAPAVFLVAEQTVDGATGEAEDVPVTQAYIDELWNATVDTIDTAQQSLRELGEAGRG